MSDITITLSPDDAQDLYDLLLFRPHNERWSDDVLAALRAAGVTPTPVQAISPRWDEPFERTPQSVKA